MLPAARVGRAVKKPGTANREQLMDIALTLFARDGAGRVSLNAIAKEAGVTPAMLHYYFSSRDALVTQLIEERFMPLRNHISRIFVDHPQDPVLALTMMVETLAHMAEKNAWFAPLWMQGDHRRDADPASAYGCPLRRGAFSGDAGDGASLAAGGQDQSGAVAGAAVYHGD